MNLNNLPTIGTYIEAEAGYFGGVIRIGGAPMGVIWAPKAQGETKGIWIADYAKVPAAQSCFDSVTNTLAMAEAGSELAKWATGLNINGKTDWVLPARDVLELAYRHLKPTTEETDAYYRSGENPSSVPPGHSYRSTPIVQTTVADFQEGGAEAFNGNDAYWSSTQYSEGYAWAQGFNDGDQTGYDEDIEFSARAVRLIQLNP